MPIFPYEAAAGLPLTPLSAKGQPLVPWWQKGRLEAV